MTGVHQAKTSRKWVIRHRSAHLLADWQPGEGGEPFRHDYLMRFPPYQRKALLLLAKLLYAQENWKDEHFPLFRGSHSLALVNAAAADLRSIARSLALFASELQRPEVIGDGELTGHELADRFAVRIDRLAKEIDLAIDAHRPPRPPRKRRPDATKR
jgi:hypothetical protein